MKKSQFAAIIACAAVLVCACVAENHAYKREKTGTEDVLAAEADYQSKLDMISPAAYNNIEGLNLEPGSYISIIGKAKDEPYWDEVERGAQQAIDDINKNLGYEGKDKVKMTYSAPAEADNVDEQVNILDEELARYPVALGIAIADAKAYEVQFDLAAESDIPVVAFDSGSDYQGLMATVSTDNGEAARMAAGKLAEFIGGTGEVAIFSSESKSKSMQERENAFKEELETHYPSISVVNVYYQDQFYEMQQMVADEINAGTYEKIPNDEMQEGEEISPDSITEDDIMDYIFAKHPDIKGCFATNGDTVKYVVKSLDRMEREGISVVGFDADEEEIEALSEGKVDGLIVQNPFGMGYATVVASARSALDMGNEAVIDTGYIWITKEDLDKDSVSRMLY